jgi:hypothetical protein
MKLKRCCLGINFDNLIDTIGTSSIMMEDKMKLQNLNLKRYPQALNIRLKP